MLKHPRPSPVARALFLMLGIVPLAGCTSTQWAQQLGLAWTGFAPEYAAPSPSGQLGRPAVPAIPQASVAGPLTAANDLPGAPVPPEIPAPSVDRKIATAQTSSIAKPTVLQVNTSTFEQHVLTADVPVLVDFYADWCGPCKALAPTLEQVAAENPQVRVVKVNIDHSPELAARYGVKSIPRLLVFKDGQIAAQQNGVVSKTRLNAMLVL